MDDLMMFLISGIATFLLLVCRRRKYDISWMHIVVILLVVGAIGYFGAIFGSWVSYGSWRGIRFYSKALFVTFTLWCIAKILKKDSTVIMDYYGPIDILALVIMKINCLRTGCCAGIELYVTDLGKRVTFPSQIAELVTAAFIFVIIILMEKKRKCDGYRYYIYLLIYGSTRFVFDYFRISPSNMIYIANAMVSVTQVFCILLIIIGIVGIYGGIKRSKSV